MSKSVDRARTILCPDCGHIHPVDAACKPWGSDGRQAASEEESDL